MRHAAAGSAGSVPGAGTRRSVLGGHLAHRAMTPSTPSPRRRFPRWVVDAGQVRVHDLVGPRVRGEERLDRRRDREREERPPPMLQRTRPPSPGSISLRPMNQESQPGPVAIASQTCSGLASTSTSLAISNSCAISGPPVRPVISTRSPDPMTDAVDRGRQVRATSRGSPSPSAARPTNGTVSTMTSVSRTSATGACLGGRPENIRPEGFGARLGGVSRPHSGPG